MVEDIFGKIPEYLLKAILYLQNYYPFYFEVMLNMEIIKVESETMKQQVPTAGVRVNKNVIELMYNDDWLKTFTTPEIVFILKHEIFHILLKAHQRCKSRNQKLFNIAQDMVINNLLKNTFGHKIDEEKLQPLFPPSEYHDEIITEKLYDWIYEKAKKNGKGKGEKGEGDGQKENFDVHLEDIDCPEEVRELITERIVSICKARGLVTSNEENILTYLRPKRKTYIDEMMMLLSNTIGLKKKLTWSRENKYGLCMRGYKRVRNKVNVILDTSGSMWGELIQKMLSFIIRNNVEIFLVQNDTEVKDHKLIRRMKELNSMKIHGGGGTIMQPAINFLIKNKMNDYPTIMLTDGYTDTLNFSMLKNKMLILTSGQHCELEGKKNHVRQIKVDVL
ncbi:MAG: VWA-like domain-containing protein [Bryobacteraceae bacterium]